MCKIPLFQCVPGYCLGGSSFGICGMQSGARIFFASVFEF